MRRLLLGLLVGAAPLAPASAGTRDAERAVGGTDRGGGAERHGRRLDGDGAREARPDRIVQRPPGQLFPDRVGPDGARRDLALQRDTGLGRPDLSRGFLERERRRDLERNADRDGSHPETDGWSDWRSDRSDAERRRVRDLDDGRVDWNRDWRSGRRDWESDWMVGRGANDGAARDRDWRGDRRPDQDGLRPLDRDPSGQPRYYPPSGFYPR